MNGEAVLVAGEKFRAGDLAYVDHATGIVFKAGVNAPPIFVLARDVKRGEVLMWKVDGNTDDLLTDSTGE